LTLSPRSKIYEIKIEPSFVFSVFRLKRICECHYGVLMRLHLFVGLLGVALAVGSCDCGTGTGNGADGGTRQDGGTAGGMPAGSGGGGASPTGGGSAGTGGGTQNTGGGAATAEVCDGVDNDKDGVIDNVDVGKDGVCDCLKIATLGYRGKFGQGDVFDQWLNGKSDNGVVALEAQELTAERLKPFQVLVIQDVREGSSGGPGVGNGIRRKFSAAEVTVLENWVRQGGGFMTLIGYSDPSEVLNVNTLLKPYNVNYGNTPILSAGGGGTAPINGWAAHPIADKVTKMGADNGYAVEGAGTVIAWEPTMGASDVARAVEVDKGHVFVWGDEWITYNSEWTTRPDYQVERFWLNTLKWLTPANQCQVVIPDIN
jgi:hypothetical protein